jgi:hypothetical protein
MVVNRELWQRPFYVNEVPPWPCPRCQAGTLELRREDWLLLRPSADSRARSGPDYDSDGEDERGVVCCLVQCSRKDCSEICSVSGCYHTETRSFEGEPTPVSVCRPRNITPTPSEAFIERQTGEECLEAAWRGAEAAREEVWRGRHFSAEAMYAVEALAQLPRWTPGHWPCLESVVGRARGAASSFAELSGRNRKERKRNWARGYEEESRAQCGLLRDVVGNPFRPAAVNPAWLSWNGGAVRRLAQAAYVERNLPAGELDPARLAVLADALEEAGCADPEILAHLRGPGPHVRGCWVIDLLLGKQ